MIEIFTTNIGEEEWAEKIVVSLAAEFSSFKINMDLSDYSHLPYPCGIVCFG